MFTSSLFAVAVRAADWSPKIAAIMIVSNIVAIAFGKATIKQKNVGLGLPAPAFFGGLSHGAMLGVTCFGHILGAGVILGLTNMGVL
ncbi:MAG: photosystem I reaction center subunit PsaK [Thermosynechococcaceae cyanobacterium MS004]|nr:photosystem I reaction center subunit PsaK [Thermosynechococcaceae cyanobacterium MS004]